MAKNYHDPEFGEMIGIAEVELLTGITKAQLRNWRKPEHHHLAKFDIYEGVGNAVWYRKMDIEAYLAEHGSLVGQSGLKRVAMPNAVSAPLIDVKFVGEQRDAFHTLNKITTENVSEWLDALIGTRGLSASKVWMDTFKEVEDLLGLPRTISGNGVRWENPGFWLPAVHTARLMTVRDQELAMSVEDVLALPVGDTPPTKETRFKN
jgi:hypothetical protein